MSGHSVERYQYIGEPGQDEEVELLEGAVAPVDRRGRTRKCLLAVMSTAVVAAVVAAVRPTPDLTAARLEDSTEETALGSPFHQCGGQDWKKSTCCQKGCACVKQTVYYSQCEPATGQRVCSISDAKHEVKMAANRVSDRNSDVKTAESNQKGAEKRLSDARDVHDKAHKVWKAASDKEAEKKKLNKEAEAESEKKSADVLKSAKEKRDKTIKEATDKVDAVKSKALGDVSDVKRLETTRKETTIKAANDKLDKILKDAKEKKESVHKKADETLASKLKAAKKEHDDEFKDAEDDLAALEKKTKDDLEQDIKDFNADAADAKKKATESRAKASKVGKEYFDKHKDWKWAHDHVEKFEKEEELRKTRKDCGKLYGNCASSKCCAFGCECVWKNKYFAQCNGVYGAGNCNWKLAEKKLKGNKKALPKLAKIDQDLEKEKNEMNKTAVHWETKAKDLHDVLKKKIKDAKKEADETIASAKKKCNDRKAAAKKLLEKKTKDAKDEAETSKKTVSEETQKTTKEAKSEAEDTISKAKDAAKAKQEEAQKKADKDIADIKDDQKSTIDAAKDECDDTIAKVRKEVKADTVKSRKVYDDAVSEREDKEKIMKHKHDLQIDAQKALFHAKAAVAKAKKALHVAHGAVASWKVAAKGGHVCPKPPPKKGKKLL